MKQKVEESKTEKQMFMFVKCRITTLVSKELENCSKWYWKKKKQTTTNKYREKSVEGYLEYVLRILFPV